MKKLLFEINVLHFFNDGLKVALVLLLPFLAKDLHTPLAQVGFLGGTINTVQVLASIPGVWIAAKIGGVKTILVAMFVYGIAFFVTGFSPSVLFIAASFVIGGLGFSVFHPIAFALITKLAPNEQRGRVVGNFTAVGDMGILALTPTIPFFAAKFGWRETAVLYSLVIFVIFLIFQVFWEVKTDEAEAIEEEIESIDIPLRKNIPFLLSIVGSFIDASISNPIFIFIPFLFLFRGVSPAFLGVFTGAFFIGSLLGKTLLGRVTDKIGNINTFILAEYSMALALILLAFVTYLPAIFVLSIFVGVFTKGTSPAVKTIVYDSIGSHKKVQKAFTIENVLNGTGAAIGPVLLGFLSQTFGIAHAFLYGAYIAAFATAPALGIALYKRRKN